MRPARLLSCSLVVLLAAACATPADAPVPPAGAAVRKLGEPYRTSNGEVYLIRVQDEYRLIRCIPSGPIAGCYEDVFKISRDSITDDTASEGRVRWNQWMTVPSVSGLEIMFLAPDRIALREVVAAAPFR